MSAISGIFYRDGRTVDSRKIKEMNDLLSHRGLDGSNTWSEGALAFGHQMLFTTPESLKEKLPFPDEDSGLIITSDARIDNRKELSELLGLDDVLEVSDSLFILKAYEKWGNNCPEKLLGDFAFAIWDENEDKLFCARDHMGVKPFYYYLSKDKFFFASEIKALLSHSEVPNTINELKIALYLKQFRTDNKLTFYKDIYSLSAANSLIIYPHESHKKTYWKLDPEIQITMDTDEEYFNAYRKILSQAINCRLRSAYSIGFDLSGGLDSSSIVCMAKKIYEDNNEPKTDINTFSQIYEHFKESDERYYIQKVVEMGGIESNYIQCDDISLFDETGKILWHQDQPFFSPFIPIWHHLYKKMQKKGIRVHLSGNGGDFIISNGYGYLCDLLTSFKWRKLITEIKFSSKRTKKSSYNEFFTNAVFPIIPKNIKHIINHILKKYQKIRLHQNLINAEPYDFINEDFSKKLKISDYSNENIWKSEGRSLVAKQAHYNSIFKSPEQETFEMIDRTASAFSIESRFPYFDIRLIEFLYAIPTDMKFRLGWNRFIQRASMTNILPNEVQWRTGKGNFISFLNKNIFKFENKRLKTMLNDHESVTKDYIDFNSIKTIYQKYQSDNIIAYIHTYQIWKAILLHQWLNYIKDKR